MKIVILSGSPHKEGTTSRMVDSFIVGASEANHKIVRSDVAMHDIHPCKGCGACKATSKCVIDDDMPIIAKEIISADCVVFASPIYYFGLCSQLKMVIDRFYAFDGKLHKKKKAVFLSAMADTSDETALSAEMQYHSIVNYFGWEDCGVIIAKGCATIDDFYKADMIPKIFSLGLNI